MTIARILGVLGILFTISACAATRSVVTPEQTISAGPAQGPAVRIETVTDARVFSLAPRSPDMPSLADGKIDDTSQTARAIGRKRGGFGKAMGDVLLPESETVADLVGQAVAQGFREAGYRVLTPKDADHAQATPIAVRIDAFWSWFSPGFWAITLSNKSDITLTGALPPLQPPATLTTSVSDSKAAAFESDWTEIAGKGLKAITDKVRQTMKPAGS